MRCLWWAFVAGWVGVHALLWSLLPPVPRWTIPSHVHSGFAFTPDGQRLVLPLDAEVTVWNAATGRRDGAWPQPGGDGDAARDISLSPDGRQAIVNYPGLDAVSLNRSRYGAATTLSRLLDGPLNEPTFGWYQFLPESQEFLLPRRRQTARVCCGCTTFRMGPRHRSPFRSNPRP